MYVCKNVSTLIYEKTTNGYWVWATAETSFKLTVFDFFVVILSCVNWIYFSSQATSLWLYIVYEQTCVCFFHVDWLSRIAKFSTSKKQYNCLTLSFFWKKYEENRLKGEVYAANIFSKPVFISTFAQKTINSFVYIRVSGFSYKML